MLIQTANSTQRGACESWLILTIYLANPNIRISQYFDPSRCLIIQVLDMLQLQGCRGDDVYAYEKRYISFIVLSILNGSIISFMMNILSHCHCRIGFLASDFLWLCSCWSGNEMVLYMHVQATDALEMTQSIRLYTLGRLKK